MHLCRLGWSGAFRMPVATKTGISVKKRGCFCGAKEIFKSTHSFATKSSTFKNNGNREAVELLKKNLRNSVIFSSDLVGGYFLANRLLSLMAGQLNTQNHISDFFFVLTCT